MIIKYSKIVHCKSLQNLSKLGFWFENKPSGNPGVHAYINSIEGFVHNERKLEKKEKSHLFLHRETQWPKSLRKSKNAVGNL
jgi:hypothetical protein